MPFPSEHAVRLKNTWDFKSGSYSRTIDAGGSGIDFIFAVNKDTEEQEIQSIRFKSNTFTKTQAKKWLTDNSITFDEYTFEAAIDITKNFEFFKACDACGFIETKDPDLAMCSECGTKMMEENNISVKCRMTVLFKNEEEKEYTLGYALDSSKARANSNIIVGPIVKSDLLLNEDDIILVKVKSVEPIKGLNKWKVNLDNLEISKVLSAKTKPSTAKEIIQEAYRFGILKACDEDIIEMDKLKLIKKESQILPGSINKEVSIIKSEKKKLIYGVVYEPSEIDAHGDYASAEEIEKAAHTYLEDFAEINLMHAKGLGKKARVVESYIAPIDFEVEGEKIKKGAWVMATKIYDPQLWDAIQKGLITGYSIEGTGQAGKPDPSLEG